MNSAEGKVWPFASRGVEHDIRPVIIETLRAAIEFGKPKGIGYYVRFLRGGENTQYLDQQHLSLETYGVLSELGRDAVQRVFHVMVDDGLLVTNSANFGAFGISDKGRAYLDNPTERWAEWSYLKVTGKEAFLYQRLRQFRKAVADELGMEEYLVFTDYTMDRIVMRLPSAAGHLALLPGMNDFKLETFGARLLAEVADSLGEYKAVAKRRYDYHSKKPGHQYARKLAEEGKNFDAISKAMGLEYTRVEWIFLDLAREKEIDAITWIEGQVSPKLLFRGTEFFRRTEKATVHMAREALRADLPSMHLCRLYIRVMELRAAQQPAPVAAAS